jgi:hypothetical protein
MFIGSILTNVNPMRALGNKRFKFAKPGFQLAAHELLPKSLFELAQPRRGRTNATTSIRHSN